MASKKPKQTLEEAVKAHLDTSMKVFGPEEPVDYREKPKENPKGPFRIFVYGTLRKGFDNHKYYLEKNKPKFLGEQKLEGFEIHCNSGLIPVMIAKAGSFALGEVYEVDDNTLFSIRGLERSYKEVSVKTDFGEAYCYVNSRPWRAEDDKYTPAIPGGDYTAWAFEKFKKMKLDRLKSDIQYYESSIKTYTERLAEYRKELEEMEK